MKRAFAVIGQFVLFVLVEAVGSLIYHPFHLQTSLSGDPLAPRSFVWDGVVLMLLVYLLILLVAALRKRFASAAPSATFALALAALTGYLLKLGFITHNW